MPKKTEINQSDQNEFREAMRGVKKISHTKITPPTSPTIKRKKITETEEEEVFPFSDYEKLPPVSSEEKIEFTRSGLQHKVLRKLRQGQYNIEAILDLHGMIVTDAKHALSHFLRVCQQRNVRHILIIHGKGRNQPVLKNKLNLWLRQTEQILAFCSATAEHGRGGALYVLLKGS